MGVKGKLNVTRQEVVTVGEVRLPVSAVVNPTNLLACLQQIQNPCSTVVLFPNLQTGPFHLRLGLRVYVQNLLIRRLSGLNQEDVKRGTNNERCR